MKKVLKKSAYDEYLSVAKSVTNAFISLFLFVLPLAITNAYYNITETKLFTFYVLGIGYLLIQLFVFLLFVGTNGKSFLNSIRFKFEFLDIAFILFGASYIISGVLSEYGASDVMFGIGSRYQGIATVLVYIALYFVITRTFSFSSRCLLWAGAGFSIVSLIALMNAVSLDPLGFYLELSAENKAKYLSTIGNVNFYSAYYNIMLPVLVVGFCKSIDKKALILFGGFVLIGSVGLLFTASESFLLGFFIGMLLLLAFFMNDEGALKRFIGCCYLFILTINVYTRLYFSPWGKGVLNFAPSGLMRLLAKPLITLILVVLLTLVLIIAFKKPSALQVIKKIYVSLIISGAILCIMGIVLFNTTLKTVDLGALNGFLKFSPRWGTNRGQNWIFCINEFKEAPILSKIFGFGPETYRNLTAKTGFYKTKSLDQAHNEYLQYLITTGLFGLGSYLSILAGTIRKCGNTIKKNAVAMSVLCGLVAYWIQASVNIAQPFTTPIMYIFIAIASKSGETDK